MRNPHPERLIPLEFLLGFLIAAAIGLTGVGAGVVTTPVLILFLDVPPAHGRGHRADLSTVTVKLLAAPVYGGPDGRYITGARCCSGRGGIAGRSGWIAAAPAWLQHQGKAKGCFTACWA